MVLGIAKVPAGRDCCHSMISFVLFCLWVFFFFFFFGSSRRRQLCALVSISCFPGLPGETDLIWTLIGTTVHQYVFTASNSISEKDFMILYLTERLAKHLINAYVSKNLKRRDLERVTSL